MEKLSVRFIALLAGIMIPAVAAVSASQPKVTLAAGTQIDVQLTTTISTSANQQGDPFLAEVEDPVFAGGEEVISPGSTLRGHIAFLKPAGRLRGRAEMRLVADDIVTKNGKQFSFKADLASLSSDAGVVKKKDDEGTLQGSGKGSKKTAEDAGIATAAGAGIGGISAGGTGALYGAGIGAVGGLIYALAKHNRNVVLSAGTELTFQLTTTGPESKASKNTLVSAPFVCATCQ
ncbi:MAG TPA: hypothetical protein VMI06_19950 [Terriglobia bacterium]|nr:hypothetical protein [Terriglobia bacterium]